MPTKLLTIRKIEAAAPREQGYWLRDGGGLFLYVTPRGTRSWRYRYRIGQVAGVYAIGHYPEITLPAARKAREQAKALVRQGIHPLVDKQAKLAAQLERNQHTLATLAQAWLRSNTGWSDYYRRQVTRYLERDALPSLGRLPITLIQASHLRPIILEVAERGAPCGAILLRQSLSQLFAYAALQGLTDHNPAALLKGMVKRPSVRHNPPLGWSDIAGFIHAVRLWPGKPATKIALQLLALTFVRTAELRRARWTDIDLKNATWSIPAANMKMRRPHLVPLSRQVVALLRALREHTGSSQYLFPSRSNPDAPIGPNTLNNVITALGYAGRFSAHGFRSTATTLLGLLGYPQARVDLQLAHARNDSSRTPYDHTKYVSSRRIIMQDWADILDDFIGGKSLAQVTRRFGPLSPRREKLLKVVEKED